MYRSIAIAVLLAACVAAFPAQGATTRILFIGNGLIQDAEIPARVARLAKAMGKDARIETIDEDWIGPEARDAIAKGWDYVVLQEDPAVRVGERARLVSDVKGVAAPIRAAGAKPALFMPWPRRDRPADFTPAIESARAAAKAIDAVPIPVAEAWLRYLSANKRASLYSGGGASRLGGDIAVLTVWFALFPAGPQEFDDAYLERLGRALDIAPERIAACVDAATRAIDEPLKLK